MCEICLHVQVSLNWRTKLLYMYLAISCMKPGTGKVVLIIVHTINV